MDDVVQIAPEPFELVYEGPDVANGSMSVRDLIEVVSGLKSSFSTISHEREIGDQYELRIRDIDHASVHLWFETVAFTKANPAAATALAAGAAVTLNAMTNVVSGAYKVITDLGVIIEAKKWLKGKRVATLQAKFPDGLVQVETPEGTLTLTREQYELLLSQRVDKALAKLVSPLGLKRVESFQVRRDGAPLAQVDIKERDYFDYSEVREDKNREGTSITGTINSLSKSNMRGTFYTSEGVHVPYKYVGGNIAQIFNGFTTHEPLRVYGKVKYGVDGIPRYIEVDSIEFLQRTLEG